MTLYEEIVKNIPDNEIDSYYSNLYVKVSDKSKEIIDTYLFKSNVTRFISKIDGCSWFEIPFAYDSFWKDRRG